MPSVAELLDLPNGAQWLKADLHVHTPASADIAQEWMNATPADLVQIAIQKGVDVLGITDHNTASWCDGVREAAEGTTLTVFPGVEISTPQGHVLALFDPTVPASHIEDLLVRVGINRESFGDLHVATPGGISAVAAEIAKAGGVAIAAHADGSRGFLNMVQVGEERRRIYLSPDLRAIEILDATTGSEHQSGSRYSRRMTCVQSSDSWPKGADRHQLDGIAYRYTFLKMGERSLSGLKLALLDPDIRVRLANDEINTPDYYILGMWVSGGFLDGQVIRLSESVSCLIGDTGAGKSVAIELLRFGLDQQPGVPKILQEVQGLLRQQLCDLGTVHILLQRGGARYLVERTWGTPPSDPIVQRLSDNDLQPIQNIEVRKFFPIKGFSQSEIIEFAREPQVRLTLTDDLIDASTEQDSISNLKVELKRNAAELVAEEARAQNAYNQIAPRANLIEAVEQIDKIPNDPRIAAQQLWYSEQALLNGAKVQVLQLVERINGLNSTLQADPAWPENIDALPNQDLLTRLKTIFQQWQEKAELLRNAVKEGSQDVVNALATVREEWDSRFSKAEDEYSKLLDSIDEEGIGLQPLSERRKHLQEQITALDEIQKDLESNILPSVGHLQESREAMLTALQNSRKAITALREEKASGLTRKLNHKIRLRVHARANTSAFREALPSISQGSYLNAGSVTVWRRIKHTQEEAMEHQEATEQSLDLHCQETIARLHATRCGVAKRLGVALGDMLGGSHPANTRKLADLSSSFAQAVDREHERLGQLRPTTSSLLLQRH